eukprot:scaffold58849_cov70-Phaeocystis_antarctica.AAC.7
MQDGPETDLPRRPRRLAGPSQPSTLKVKRQAAPLDRPLKYLSALSLSFPSQESAFCTTHQYSLSECIARRGHTQLTTHRNTTHRLIAWRISYLLLLLAAEGLVEQAGVEVELAAKDLLIDRVLASAGNREVAKHEHVHGRKLEVVRVGFRDAERERLRASVEKVEDDGGDHRGRHRERSRA